MLHGIIDEDLACKLLESYFREPGRSLFECASPYVLTHVLRKNSLLRSDSPRRTTCALLVTILWVASQTADDDSFFLAPGRKATVCEGLRKLMLSLIQERDQDSWDRDAAGMYVRGHMSNPGATGHADSEGPPVPSVDDVLTFLLLTIVVSGGDFKADCFRWLHKALRLSRTMGLNREDGFATTSISCCTGGTTCACRSCDAARSGISVPEVQEERRRVFWLLFCLDRHLALSLNSPLHILDHDCVVYRPLPDDEWEAFDLASSPIYQASERVIGPPTTISGTSFFDYFLPLMTILGDVIQLHRRRCHPRFAGVQLNNELDADTALVEGVLAKCKRSIADLAHLYGVDELLDNASAPASDDQVISQEGPTGAPPLASLSRHSVSSMPSDMMRSQSRRTANCAQARLVTVYSKFILHVLHVLLHGKWDPVSMLENDDGWVSSPGFVKCASHSIAASEAVSQILACDPELAFMPYLFGIYLLHGSFILLLFADRMPQIGLNESVERACEILIRAHEVCVVTLSTQFQSIEVEALWPISCLLADYLDLPQHVTDNIEACVLNYDMTRLVSKTAIYRRWQETDVPPTLHDVVGMYVVGLGRLHPRFREAMARHCQTWLMWEGDMRPTFAARMGSERIHDAPIRWDGNVDVVHPHRPSHRDARIDMQLAHHDRFGHAVQERTNRGRNLTWAKMDRPTPADTDIPGGFPETPASIFPSQHTTPATHDRPHDHVTNLAATHIQTHDDGSRTPTQNTTRGSGSYFAAAGPFDTKTTKEPVAPSPTTTDSSTPASEKTLATPAGELSQHGEASEKTQHAAKGDITDDDDAEAAEATEPQFEEMKTGTESRPALGPERSSTIRSEEDLFRVLSRRRTSVADSNAEEDHEIERLMSRLFGQKRQQQSEEEKTRHSGVVFRDLTVKGVGLGASLQPTVGDIFLGLPRFLKNLVTKGPKAATGKPPVRDLISHFDGCVRPGEILLVLGRPGSGCTTFLKAFCNQRAGFQDVLGDVTYGGTDAAKMAKDYRGEIIYNPEDDLHYATLSVKRTLTFALRTRTPGKESRLEGESRDDYVNEFLRVAAKLLWIEHTMDTKVGNEYIRGVSGGERKRVSIAEALITRASVQGWDNSSKGLDASTAVEYVQSLRTLTNMAQVSTAVSLYQAGESLYDLVDKVLLIDQGQCLYYGSSDHAKQYFLDLGFDCPDRWTTADFLTSVTDPFERSIRSGWEDRIPRSAEDFAAVYKKSDAYKKNIQDIEEFESHLKEQMQSRARNQSKKNKKKNYTIPFHQQVFALAQRQLMVTLGDKASLIGKWGGIVFQGLIVGSLFYNLPDNTNGAFTRGGVLFFILLFNALLALAEQTAAFESKPILLKHKNFSFYRPSAYAVAQTFVDVPLVAIQVILFDVIIYWMAGLAATPSQFFISLLILWTVTMVTYSFFRAISAIFKTLDDATKVTGVAIQILVVYTGYLIPPSSMRPWFGWLRWINWIQYGFECLMANEFYDLDMECVTPYLVPQGPGATSQYQSCALAGSSPGSTTVSGSAYIQESFSYSRGHLWRNFGFLWAFFAFFLAISMIGMEMMKPNAGGAAVTVYKRGQVPKSVQKSIETGGRKNNGGDEESGSSTQGEVARDHAKEQDEKDQEAMKNVAGNETIFTFQDVNYTIPYQGGERKLLDQVQGFVRPGKLTALMGASGAGKTTLLNTLAQRINFGVITGDFLVDGRPLPKSFQRATGFAEQMDVHEPTATVREALQFSALLRQPREVSKEEKYAYCETIIELLEMQDIAGATIGNVGEGLNQEQRKRLTIGVELASKPELLMFLDEPTSGLDSGAAFNIVRFLRKLADAGQAILCTIHQPSAVLFEHFDELILLKSGGRVVYAGELGKDSQKMIQYFETNGGPKCPRDENPAEWMLEVIGAGNPDYKGQDWGDMWLKSKNYEEQSREIASMNEKRRNVEHSKNVQDDREYAMPLSTQTMAVVKRSFISYWRTPNYIMGKLILHIFTGLFNTFTFYKLGNNTIDMQSRLFSIFMTLTISPPLIQQLQPVFLHSRSIFQSRENNAKIYSWVAWTTGAVLVEIPYAIVAGGIYFNCWWWGIAGYKMSSFSSGFTFLCVILFELYYVGFGQAIAAFSPNELLASLLVPIFFLFVVSFCGVVVPPQQLPTFWREWMYWLTPFHYLLEAFLGVAIHDQPVRCDSGEFATFSAPPGQTCESYVGPYVAQAGGYVQTAADGMCQFCQYATGDEFGAGFSVYYSHIWRDFGIVCGFIAFNYAVVYFATYLRFKGRNPLKGVVGRMKQKKQKKQQK